MLQTILSLSLILPLDARKSSQTIRNGVEKHCSQLVDFVNEYKSHFNDLRSNQILSEPVLLGDCFLSHDQKLEDSVKVFNQSIEQYERHFNKISSTDLSLFYQVLKGIQENLVDVVSSKHEKLEVEFYTTFNKINENSITVIEMFKETFSEYFKLASMETFNFLNENLGREDKTDLVKLESAYFSLKKEQVELFQGNINLVNFLKEFENFKNELIRNKINTDFDAQTETLLGNFITYFNEVEQDVNLFKENFSKLIERTFYFIETSLNSADLFLSELSDAKDSEKNNYEEIKSCLEQVYSEIFGFLGKNNQELYYDENIKLFYKLEHEKLQQTKEEKFYNHLVQNKFQEHLKFLANNYVEHKMFNFCSNDNSTESNEKEKTESSNNISAILTMLTNKIIIRPILSASIFCALIGSIILILKKIKNRNNKFIVRH